MKNITKTDILKYIENGKLKEFIKEYTVTLENDELYLDDCGKIQLINTYDLLNEWVNETIDNWDCKYWDIYLDDMIYNSDCWDYLADNNITDFSEAIEEGNTTLYEIANYYYIRNTKDELYNVAAELLKHYTDMLND